MRTSAEPWADQETSAGWCAGRSGLQGGFAQEAPGEGCPKGIEVSASTIGRRMRRALNRRATPPCGRGDCNAHILAWQTTAACLHTGLEVVEDVNGTS